MRKVRKDYWNRLECWIKFINVFKLFLLSKKDVEIGKIVKLGMELGVFFYIYKGERSCEYFREEEMLDIDN